MAYYNPHITGQYNPLYTANNKGLGYCSPVPQLVSLPDFWTTNQ